jgi:hypothetical protein
MRLYNVRALSDCAGDFLLQVRCRRCEHRRALHPVDLARQLGADASLEQVKERLYCGSCGARDLELWADSGA